MRDVVIDILSRTKNITISELENLEYMQDQLNILYELIMENQKTLGSPILSV